MKLSTTPAALLTILTLASPVLSKRCTYHLYGSIVKDVTGWSWSGHLDDGLGIYPNKIMCGQGSGNNAGHRNKDGSWDIGCQNGFSLKLSANAGKATVVNGALTDSWNTGAKLDMFECAGACGDRGGVCIHCPQYDFTSDYQCN
jgi:hypothetical protein